MAYIHYIGGESRGGKLVSVAIGMSSDPESHLKSLNGSMPFNLRILGLEEGAQQRLETVREDFKSLHIKGPWFKPAPTLITHIESLEPLSQEAAKKKRVSLDLDPEEFADLEVMVNELGEKMKSKVLRRSVRFYRALLRYKAQGYLIQAVKGGKQVQFPDLDDVRDPPKEDD